ncbi:hypothetical protein JZ751_008859 [Albula glossodonta]|uniref:Uncharacterized protein n=1 Tax=Albula glossodonta TaxID=121402 RepID=A0A8T2NZE5_9TELE|nr:hypothetical protein JZ751_008859 [Albula glossodonta]
MDEFRSPGKPKCQPMSQSVLTVLSLLALDGVTVIADSCSSSLCYLRPQSAATVSLPPLSLDEFLHSMHGDSPLRLALTVTLGNDLRDAQHKMAAAHQTAGAEAVYLAMYSEIRTLKTKGSDA